MTDQQQQKTATTATNKKQKENHKETGHPKYQVLVSIWSSWNIYALLMVEYIGTTVSEWITSLVFIKLSIYFFHNLAIQGGIILTAMPVYVQKEQSVRMFAVISFIIVHTENNQNVHHHQMYK